MNENDENTVVRLLTVPEVADLARVSERTAYTWIERGLLRAVRPAGTRVTRIRAADFERMMNESR